MPLRLDDLPHVYRLGEHSRGFLQVLLPEIVLSRERSGLTLDIDIRDDLLCIKENAGKQALREAVAGQVGEGKATIESNLCRFRDDTDILSYRLDAAAAPFRYANAGVLPIVRLDGEDYFCTFYRESFPMGWNIANGASDNERELLDPEAVLLREFCEELFVADITVKRLYQFDPDRFPAARRAFEHSRSAWQNQPGGPDLKDYEIGPIPVKWIEGPDRLRVRMGNEQRTTAGCFVSITPEDSAVELDRIAMINLRGDISLFDGELLDNRPLNRVVGLFALSNMREVDARVEFRPDRIFHSGAEGDPADLERLIAKYLDDLAGRGGAVDQRALYERTTGSRYDLCPITRSIIRRYLGWEAERDKGDKGDDLPLPRAAGGPVEAPRGEARVFISYRSQDAEIGRWVYQALDRCQISAFFSEASIAQGGDSDYARAIDDALEHADCMVVIGTDAECFDSGWVGYEWRSFLNEIHSKRKEGGKVFTFSHGVASDKLPYALRGCQNVPYSPGSPEDSLAALCQTVVAALGQRSKS